MTPELEKQIEEMKAQLEELSNQYDLEYVLHVDQHIGPDKYSTEVHSFKNGGVLEVVIRCLLALVYGIR